ncbi:hypothetical protein IV203_026290 [Nitzschia inconspicua]|uniref:Uncharacterized protein n=1 Tax=Nitzschia inconspicua TaxID=303405 RepID=A0A9K3PCL5_9STRA|nr:hypothetical protein IV203_006863 [Nitzschia inconspicua]KAG7362930.1 hypothetical protein IV203_026290 [Nitzschia inconspicua]
MTANKIDAVSISTSAVVDDQIVPSGGDSYHTIEPDLEPENDHMEAGFPYSTTRRKISFTSIEVREYPILPGDNPAGFSGVPVTIDWTPLEIASCSVDEYEATKAPPRNAMELRMPPNYRRDLLQQLGFSRSEILSSLKHANLVRNQRRRTFETMHLSLVQEAVEKVKRAALNATIRRAKKSKEKQLLESFTKTKFMSKPSVKVDSSHSLETSVDTDDESLGHHMFDETEKKMEQSPSLFRHNHSIMIR